MTDCIFCKIANHKIPSEIVFEDAELIAFRDINPKAKVHILIIPKQHIESVETLTLNDTELMGKMILKARELANKEDLNSGYRLILNTGKDSGAEVLHLHLHLDYHFLYHL